MKWALYLQSLSQYSCRLLIRINWAAIFRLLEVEAGRATYKDFIHSGKNAFINTDKHVHNYKSQLRTFGKQYKILANSYLGSARRIIQMINVIQMKIIHVF